MGVDPEFALLQCDQYDVDRALQFIKSKILWCPAKRTATTTVERTATTTVERTATTTGAPIEYLHFSVGSDMDPPPFSLLN